MNIPDEILMFKGDEKRKKIKNRFSLKRDPTAHCKFLKLHLLGLSPYVRNWSAADYFKVERLSGHLIID